MIITLNNKPEDLKATELSVSKLLELKNFTFKMLVVKINGQLVRRHEFDTALIREGDEVAVIHLISGG